MRVTLRTGVAVSLLLLVVNAGYIWAFATPSIFYMGNVLAHLTLGIIVCAAGLVLLTRDGELRKETRTRRRFRGDRCASVTGSNRVSGDGRFEDHWSPSKSVSEKHRR